MLCFKAKMHQIRFRLGSAPFPVGGFYNAPPDLLAGFKRNPARRNRRDKEKGKRKKRKKGKEKGKKGRRERGGGKAIFRPPPMAEA